VATALTALADVLKEMSRYAAWLANTIAAEPGSSAVGHTPQVWQHTECMTNTEEGGLGDMSMSC